MLDVCFGTITWVAVWGFGGKMEVYNSGIHTDIVLIPLAVSRG